MRRELKDMGEHILRKQCSDLGLLWDQLEVGDIRRLTSTLSAAIISFMGREKAERIVREIEKFTVLEELKLSGEVGRKVDERRRMEALRRLGDICLYIGEWENALDYFGQAYDIASKLGQPGAALEISDSIGSVYLEMGDWERARATLERLLEAASSAGDAEAEAKALRTMGKLHWRLGEFDAARDCTMKSIDYYSGAGDDHSLACLYKDLGDVYGEQGEHDTGLEYYARARDLFDPRKDPYNIANIEMNMGVIYSLKKDWRSAAEHYEACIEITSREGYTNTLAWALFNAAEAYTKMKELDRAEDALLKSADMLRRTDDRMGLAGVSMKFGELCQERGDWQGAVRHFEDSISALGTMGLPKYLADATHELGVTLAKLGRKDEARERYLDAMDLYRELGITRSVENVRRDLEKLDA